MNTEEFVHALSNKLSIIDISLNLLKKEIPEEKLEVYKKVEKSVDASLELVREFKNQAE